MYISNAPKYAIDSYLTDDIQAIYNMIFMPAFAVMLIANFIFNPILTTYAELWLSEKRSQIIILKSHIKKQFVVIAGLTAVGLLIAFTIGIPVLSFIFGVDLGPYRYELCVVMLGGGALAYATYFSTVITIIRMQETLIFCYGAVAIAAKVMSKFFVVNYGIMGAAAMYSVLMAILAVVLFAITWHGVKKESLRLKRLSKK